MKQLMDLRSALYKVTDDDIALVQKTAGEQYSNDYIENIRQETNNLAQTLTERLQSDSHKDKQTISKLKSDLSLYKGNLTKLKMFGFDTNSHQQQLKLMQQLNDSQSRFYSQFKDENSYFDWTMRGKYSGKKVADIDNIIGYRQII